jgi:hypothetical protein
METTDDIPWKQAEDAVVAGDAETLDAILRAHGDALRAGVPSTWLGGLAPSYAVDDARMIVARENHVADWDAYAALAAARRDPASPVARFEAAVDAIVGGDLEALQRLLREDPALVRARSTRLHGSTLLHYVGANGVESFRQRTPPNVVAIAEALLDAGADVDAVAGMYGGGSRTLMLAATSIHPMVAGVQEPLMACLLGRGARVGDDQGDAAWSRLIRDCHANGRPTAAQFLAVEADRHGVELDLEAAAGLGRLARVRVFFAADGSLSGATPDQRRDGFTWACEYGHADVVRFLIEHGIDARERLPKHHGQTGLHWAAWGAHIDTVQVLLDAGCPVDTRDERFDTTALGWALHAWGGGGSSPGDARYVEVARRLVAAGATVDPAWLARSEDELPVRLRDGAEAMRAALEGR